MLAKSTALLNVDLVVLSIGDRASAKQVLQSKAGHIDGAISDPLIASKSNVLTVEIGHINADALEAAERSRSILVHPPYEQFRTSSCRRSTWTDAEFQFRVTAPTRCRATPSR